MIEIERVACAEYCMLPHVACRRIYHFYNRYSLSIFVADLYRTQLLICQHERYVHIYIYIYMPHIYISINLQYFLSMGADADVHSYTYAAIGGQQNIKIFILDTWK